MGTVTTGSVCYVVYRRRRALSTCENVLGRVEYLLGLGMRRGCGLGYVCKQAMNKQAVGGGAVR